MWDMIITGAGVLLGAIIFGCLSGALLAHMDNAFDELSESKGDK